jgi:ATP-dependent DNA helicase DinG
MIYKGGSDTVAIQSISNGSAIARLKQTSIAGYEQLTADRKFGEKITLNKCKDILSVIFSEILPQYGFTVRKSQVELAEEILEALNRRKVILAEGETGTGKTWAYLIAALLIKRGRVNDFWNMGYYPNMQYIDKAHMPIVVTTSSIALQKALVEDYIPMLSEILLDHGIINTSITAVLRKGRGHYVCEWKLRVYIQNEADPVKQQYLKEILRMVRRNINIDISEITSLTPYIKRKICVPSRCDCHCPHYATCAYMDFRSKAQNNKIDVQVCNHHIY